MKEIVCYTVAETAKLLKLSELSVYNMLKKGTLKGVKIGGRFRITEDAIEELLKNGTPTEAE